MNIAEFNQLPMQQATEILRNCVQISSWGENIVVHRPFINSENLYNYAKQQTDTWTWQQISEALGNHPQGQGCPRSHHQCDHHLKIQALEEQG